jgi:delta24(24(1))-sterol reductase
MSESEKTPTRRATLSAFSPATPRRPIHDYAAEVKANPQPPQLLNAQPHKAKKSEHEELEFGGALGALALMIWSHYILYYFWYCLETAKGHLVLPAPSVESLKQHWGSFVALFMEKGIPSQEVWTAYGIFFLSQLVLAAVLPGLTVTGLGTDSSGKRLKYVTLTMRSERVFARESE